MEAACDWGAAHAQQVHVSVICSDARTVADVVKPPGARKELVAKLVDGHSQHTIWGNSVVQRTKHAEKGTPVMNNSHSKGTSSLLNRKH